MVTSKGGWPRRLLGVMAVEGREVELRDEIEQEEHQVVFGQRVSRRNRLLAALLGIPRAVVLASIVHRRPPAQRIRDLQSAWNKDCAESIRACTDRPFSLARDTRTRS